LLEQRSTRPRTPHGTDPFLVMPNMMSFAYSNLIGFGRYR
jgi:hypothetical protein